MQLVFLIHISSDWCFVNASQECSVSDVLMVCRDCFWLLFLRLSAFYLGVEWAQYPFGTMPTRLSPAAMLLCRPQCTDESSKPMSLVGIAAHELRGVRNLLQRRP